MPELNSKLRSSQANDKLDQQIQKFAVEVKIDHIALLFPDRVPFGILGDKTFKLLGPILQREPALVLEGVEMTREICERIRRINKSADRQLKIDINVYGTREDAKKIGDELASKKIWLQRPDRAELPYENPQTISFPGLENIPTGVNDVRGNSNAKRPHAEEERIQQIITEVHGSLHRAEELETTTGDRRLKTALLEYVSCCDPSWH